MDSKKIAYYIILGLFSTVIFISIWNYLFNYEATVAQLEILGYPGHLIHPLALAQIVGIVIIITNKGGWIINWAYAGFFYNLVFAIIAHHSTNHGNGAAAVICLILLFTSYVLNKQLKNERESNTSISNQTKNAHMSLHRE
ncbi:MAG: hypothetical protein COA50_14860 [Flavobacteriaceae bacterium]|nr:MAG: hypothetical protein COA50_14860 [Flavobacteriaceae bacterium]